MLNFEAGHIEQQIHDDVLMELHDTRERLIAQIAKTFKIPQENLRIEKTLTDTLLQLIKEHDPLIYRHNEDIWRYLANHMEIEEEAGTMTRTTDKNSFYNRSKAKAYIDAYWQDYNNAYPTFRGGGGDCANFVSQVLYAGGMPWVDDGNPNHYTWFTNWYCKPGASNKDGDKRVTLSWKVAASFKRHWEKRAAKQIVISYKDALNNMKELSTQVYIGDPVQFCYANGVSYHTLVVTGYAWDKAAGVSDIVLASHTIDSNKRSLYNTMLKYPKDYLLRIFVIKEGE